MIRLPAIRYYMIRLPATSPQLYDTSPSYMIRLPAIRLPDTSSPSYMIRLPAV